MNMNDYLSSITGIDLNTIIDMKTNLDKNILTKLHSVSIQATTKTKVMKRADLNTFIKILRMKIISRRPRPLTVACACTSPVTP